MSDTKRKKFNLLLLEDNQDDVELTRRYLEKNFSSFSIQSAPDTKTAKPLLEKDAFDLIISDHNLGQETAFDVIKVAQKFPNAPPILILSGQVGDEIAVDLYKAGVKDFVSKNNLTRLSQSIEKILDETQTDRQVKILEDKIEILTSLPQENPNPVMKINKDGHVVFVNSAGKEIGAKMGIVENKPVDPQRWKWLEPILKEGIPNEFEEKFGDEIYHFKLFPFSNGRYLNVYGTNVTRLRESETFLQSIIDNIPNMVFVKEAKDLRFVEFNKAGQKLIGQLRENLIGKNDFDFFPKEQAEFFTQKDRAVLKSGKPINIPEETILDWDGNIRYLHTIKVPIMDEGNNPIYLLGISEDITDRKNAEDALKKSQEQVQASQKMEAIGNLAGGIAHDFNNLTSAILGYSHFLLSEVKDETQKEDILEIKKAAERAAELTQQLLTFSRKRVINPAIIDVNAVFKEMIKMLQRTLGEDINLKLNLQDNPSLIKVDQGSLEQAILNLAINARDAMPNGGLLVIETKTTHSVVDENKGNFIIPAGTYISISISDSGTGMTPEVKEKIFDPFFTTKAQGKGTGLGLSTVYGMVKQTGGYIWVYSEPGTGTTFRLLFPFEKNGTSATQTKLKPVKNNLKGNETILLVEDDLALRRFSSRTLREKGYKVFEAENGKRAIELLQKETGPFHLVLSDVVMPEMNGGELAEWIRKNRPEIKILFMSGYPQEIIAEKKIIEQEIPLLQKPFIPHQLLEEVQKVLKRSNKA